MSRPGVLLLLGAVFFITCAPVTSPLPSAPKPHYFSNLSYENAIARYRQTVEKKFKDEDLSYILSLLSYGITNFYGGKQADAKRAFLAAYKVDAGERPEAAKFYDWLVVDSRTVYKLKKRERELVHFYLGLCYLFENNLEEALVEFKKLRQFDQGASQLPIVNFYTGLLYEKMEKFDDALIEFRQLETLGIKGLVRNVELIRDSGFIPTADSIELVVQVDHQTVSSIGRTEVYADSSLLVTVLPEVSDSFAVRLSKAEANRKAAQEAGAKAARIGLRVLSAVLLDKVLPGIGKELADNIADITLGKEEQNRDIRAWGYAPLNFAFARMRIPNSTSKVRLIFYNRAGNMLGYCDYPLQGENQRAFYAAGMFFIVAGLAEEFYVY